MARRPDLSRETWRPMGAVAERAVLPGGDRRGHAGAGALGLAAELDRVLADRLTRDERRAGREGA
ncbi:hypothetical protein, partial [Elioraea sp.]|uniref:hypothetical protein n=1 Tax=Elioraea sp. TaxID=2185103 RepID=UPI003F725591